MHYDENILWAGKPSQFLSFGPWFFGILVSVMAVLNGGIVLAEVSDMMGGRVFSSAWLLLGLLPLGPAVYKSLQIYCTEYYLTAERLKVRRGILNKRTDEIELHRVRDYAINEPLDLRMIGAGNVRVISVDRTIPVIDLMGIKDPERVRNIVRHAVTERQVAIGWSEHEVT